MSNKPVSYKIMCSLKSKYAVVVVVFAYFIFSRLLYLAYLGNLGLLCMPHPGTG